MTEAIYKSVIDVLLERFPVPEEELGKAREEAVAKDVSLEDILVESGLVPAAALVLSKSQYLEIPPLSLDGFTPDNDLVEILPQQVWTQLEMLPVCKNGKLLTVAVADPFNIMGLENLKMQLDYDVVPVVVDEKDLLDIWEMISKNSAKGLEDILRDIEDDSELEVQEDLSADDLENADKSGEDAPVIRIVNSILIEALRKGSSDIHIEPMEKTMRLRYRTDGVLTQSPSPPKSVQAAISSRIKIMSNLDIAERRVPQDGRFKIKALGKEVDIRVSYLPTVHGEKIVMRILDKTALAPSLEALGLAEKPLADLKYAVSQPYGMILVTGPTGSGKTTTLYSALQELNNEGVNITTVEDPVEYQLHNINQIQTHADVGLTFAAGLRSILRQDPDVVMIGEIRDHETASIAVQAALTGHLVLSTLHTNDAPGAIARMAYMGIEPFLLSSSVLMTQAQRLFRRLCPFCKKEVTISKEVLIENHIDLNEFGSDTVIYGADGCPKCGGTGYKGRGAIMEILLLNDRIKRTILETSESTVIRGVAVEEGMQTLRSTGFDKVRAGETSVEEILRITSE